MYGTHYPCPTCKATTHHTGKVAGTQPIRTGVGTRATWAVEYACGICASRLVAVGPVTTFTI